MTENQKLRADLLRLDGKSKKEVAEILGVSIGELGDGSLRKYRYSLSRYSTVKYPNIEAWIMEKGITRSEFSRLCGTNIDTMGDILNGKSRIRKDRIDVILKVTGLTYEFAFAEN